MLEEIVDLVVLLAVVVCFFRTGVHWHSEADSGWNVGSSEAFLRKGVKSMVLTMFRH